MPYRNFLSGSNSVIWRDCISTLVDNRGIQVLELFVAEKFIYLNEPGRVQGVAKVIYCGYL